MWGKVEKSTHSEEGEVFGLTEGAAKLQRWVWYRTLSSITLSHSFLAPFYSSYILAIFFSKVRYVNVISNKYDEMWVQKFDSGEDWGIFVW